VPRSDRTNHPMVHEELTKAEVTGDLVVSAVADYSCNELRWRFSGSGGPGGQHANTSNTKVMFDLEHRDVRDALDSQRTRLVSEFGPVVRVVAVDERSQTRKPGHRARTASATGCGPGWQWRAYRRRLRDQISIARRLTAKHRRSERKTERRSRQEAED